MLFYKSLQLQDLSVEVTKALIITQIEMVVFAVQLSDFTNLSIKAFFEIFELF